MYTHHVLELLKTFSDKDLMRFSKFLNSPYFNGSKRIIRLYQILKKYHPEFESRNLTRENVYKLVYGKVKYNDSTFRNLVSDLLQLALQFLMYEGLEKKKIESSLYITQELFSRGAMEIFRVKMKNISNSLNSNKILNSDFFHSKFRTETDNFYANLLTQKVLKKSFVISESKRLINGLVSFLNYFVLESLVHNENLLNYSRTYNIKKNIDKVNQFIEILNFDKLISYIKENSDFEIPIVELYYNLLKAYTNFDDESYYFEFKKSLFKCSEYLGLNDNSFLHSRLIGYCIRKKNLGVHTAIDLTEEIFQLNKLYIEKEFYRTETSSYLPFDIYRNVLLNCISARKLKEMEEFINDYSKKLIPKHIESVVNYSYALLLFEKKQFSKALNCLNKIKFDQFVYKIDMKNLQLKIYYELGHLETAISIIDSYKHFLKNNVLISESRKILHNNFVGYTNKLIQCKLGSQKTNLSFVRNQIEKSSDVFDKEWLLDKAVSL